MNAGTGSRACKAVSQSALLPLILVFGVLTASPAAADSCQWDPAKSQQVNPASPDAAAILKSAVADVTKQLGKPAKLGPATIAKSGQWAFVRAPMLGADGQPIDYQGTPFAQAAENGGKSKTYLGLLQQAGQGWNVVNGAVGPTDAAYEGWPPKYGSPPVFLTCN